MTDKVAGVEFAGLENDRLENDGLENDGSENDGLEQEQTHVLPTLKTFNVYDMYLFEAQIWRHIKPYLEYYYTY